MSSILEDQSERYTLPPDLYSRNFLIAQGIEQYKQTFSLHRARILDIGGKNGRLRSFLAPEDELIILDIREGDEPGLIVGDGTNMTEFSDQSFDIVVSGDVYEHIPPEKREAFLSESLRVSKDLVILAAPFDRPGVHQAEVIVNDFFKSLLGRDHEWLREHLEQGLPDENELKRIIEKRGCFFSVCESNDLENWVLLQLLVFYSFCFGVSEDAIARFYQNYNQDLLEVEDFQGGSYRQVYYICKNNFTPQVSYRLQPWKRRILRRKLFQVIGWFTRERSLELEQQHRSIDQQGVRIGELEEFLKGVEARLAEKEQLVREKENIEKEQKAVVQELNQVVDAKENHIRNLDGILQARDVKLQDQQKQVQQLSIEIQRTTEGAKVIQQKLQDRDGQLELLIAKIEERAAVIHEQKKELARLHEEDQRALRGLRDKIIQGEQQQTTLKNALQKNEQKSQELHQKLERKNLDFQRLTPDYQEFQAVKRSMTYRFLCFHRGITIFFVQQFRKIFQAFSILCHQGLRVFLRLFWHRPRSLSLNEQYQIYLQQHVLADEQLQGMRDESQAFTYRPKISIITPVYNVDPRWLNKCIQSVLDQSYSSWELCLYDDASTNTSTIDCLRDWKDRDSRIKMAFGTANLHISGASNKALEMATGEFVGLLDHDDELTPDALYEVVRLLNEDPKTDMIYSDEDKLELDGTLVDPHFKPDWSPETFESVMYTCHFGVYRKNIVDGIEGFRKGYEGSQDYDLVLRFTEKTNRIRHIPKVLYHWRKIPGSTAAMTHAKSYAYEAAKKALHDRLSRTHQPGKVERGIWIGSYRIRREIGGNPMVSIIIPFKDKADYLERCLKSVLTSSYPNFEILLISNNSQEEETFSTVKRFQKKDSRIKFFEYNQPFNYSAINNWAAKKANGKYLLLLNNDIEVMNRDWLEVMLELALVSQIGAVGVKLLYPNKTIQHAGVILGVGGVANHAFRAFTADDPGYFGYANVIRNYSAVTGACLMVEKKKFFEVGGLDEEHLAIAFNDVDFCLKLLQKGYRNVYTPFARLYHYESLSRGPEDTPEKQKRFANEVRYMMNKWGILLKDDPYYNPHLTLEREDFGLKI